MSAIALGGTSVLSRSGISAQFTASGALRRLEMNGQSLLLYPAGELEAPPANLYLRHFGDDVAVKALLGPGSGAQVELRGEGPIIAGQWRGLEYQVRFRLAAGVPAWFWHVRVVNRSGHACRIDLVYTHDIALAPLSLVRTNEYYVSQYLDVTPVATDQVGTTLAVRQNLPGLGAPWVLMGSLRQGVGWATDGLQLGRRQRAGAPLPALLEARLPSARLQHEHTMVALQDQPATVEPGDHLSGGFFGICRASHPAATSDRDASEAAVALGQPEARPPEVASAICGTAAAGSLFEASPWLDCQALTDEELTGLVGSDRHHPELAAGKLLAFFLSSGMHVVLQAKERTVLRPHAQILRTGNRLVPDVRSLTSTAWMTGIFHSHVTQGHVGRNRILSTRRGYLGWHRACGLRVFVELGERQWTLLDEPSAWAVSPDSCTWWYRHAEGLIEVVAGAPSDVHELTLRVRLLSGRPRRLLICANLAPDDDDGQETEPPSLSIKEGGVTVGGTAFTLDWGSSQVEQVGRDEALFLDGQSRTLPWVTIMTRPTSAFALRLRARSTPDAEHATGLNAVPVVPDYWPALTRAVELVAPATSQAHEEVARLDGVLPWFVQNALVHYLAPRGIEQFNGGAWGTRDVCQGPVSLLLALDQPAPLRDLLTRVFRAQRSAGDWPQAFEFFPGSTMPWIPAHGDVIYWPLLALAEYLRASGDSSLIRERLPFAGDGDEHAAPVLDHVRRALACIGATLIPGSPLPAYGHGDWNDSLQPANAELASRLCSTWTVTLHIESLRTLSTALREVGQSAGDALELAGTADRLAAAASDALQQRLMVDGVLAGYALFGDDGSVEPLIHPRDRRTGLRYGLLHVSSAITSGLLPAEAATSHAAIVDAHLMGVDGARLFDRPVAYRGGPMSTFLRAEAATFFGREIGLMYMHAHLRYAESLAQRGDGAGLLRALAQANPIGVTLRTPGAQPRQSNCYFSSSDAGFADRYQAAAEYPRVRSGDVPLEGGWRVYSSGPGLVLRLVVERWLGLRRRASTLEIDPVLMPTLNGLRARVPLAGVPMQVAFTVGARGVGPRAVRFNGELLPMSPLSNFYRSPGVAVEMSAIHRRRRSGDNQLAIEVG